MAYTKKKPLSNEDKNDLINKYKEEVDKERKFWFNNMIAKEIFWFKFWLLNSFFRFINLNG